MLRLALFLGTNLAVLLVLSLAFRVLGIEGCSPRTASISISRRCWYSLR